MFQLKKILITLPEEMLEEVDRMVLADGTNRSEFIREAMKYYMSFRRKKDLEGKLKKGYLEMAQINLSIANMCMEADNQELKAYEEKLAECEK
ncbi:MAG: ribbon-helix-helix protein, CopG family [Bacillota bacterium]|nr:ribbon-helix-helix protein, CopG family [Bacillota bacterium]